jgi:hypothetical protein
MSTVRITLDDGRWLDMRPMYISDMLAIQEAERRLSSKDGGERDVVAEFVAVCEAITPGVEARSWDGPITQMTPEQAMRLARLWGNATEDMVMPPLSGSASAKPQPSPPSTGKARSSHRRSTGKSSPPPDAGASPRGS